MDFLTRGLLAPELTPAQVHLPENVGGKAMDGIVVEIKKGKQRTENRSGPLIASVWQRVSSRSTSA